MGDISLADKVADAPVRVRAELPTCGLTRKSELLNQAMLMLAQQPRSIFIGQGVAADGVATFDSLDGIPLAQRIEFPVAEELNVGFATGLSLLGYLSIVVIPRIDFLMRAMDQIVNHLDKIESMSQRQYRPKIIIRTRVGGRTPLDPGPQHSQDHSAALQSMLTNIHVVTISDPSQILSVYTDAVNSDRSVIVVENMG